MITMPVTAAGVAALLIILQQLLMLNVGLHRTKVRVGVGTGADPDLERKIRRHGNLAESSGLFVAALALSELLGAAPAFVLGVGAVFVVARFSHAIGFSSLTGSHLVEGSPLFLGMRVIGAFGTALSGLALGGLLLYTIATGVN